MLKEKVKVSCSNCGTTNYYPGVSVKKKVVCGRCKTVLPQPGKVIEPQQDQILMLFRKASLPLLIDFYSPTRASCHIMRHIIDALAKRRAGELTAIRINVDQYPEIAAQFGIQEVPTYVVLSKENERGRTKGAMSEADFSLWVANLA